MDIEQLTIPEPPGADFSDYPLWPPRWWVDTIHNYGRTYDPLQIARPVWWKVTIWYDVLLFGPLYFYFLWATIRGDERMRLPAIIYGSIITTIVVIICSEEVWGPHKAHRLGAVLALNAPWFLTPLSMIARWALVEHPFTSEAAAAEAASPAAAAGLSSKADVPALEPATPTTAAASAASPSRRDGAASTAVRAASGTRSRGSTGRR